MENLKKIHSKKTVEGCATCWLQNYYCGKCKGLCIFSVAFLRSCRKDRKITKSLSAKFYQPDFDIIRNCLSVQQKEDLKNGINNQEKQAYNEYELLQYYHKDTSFYPEINRSHEIPFSFHKGKKISFLSNPQTISGRCRYHQTTIVRNHYNNAKEIPSSRFHKKKDLLKQNQDFYLI